jgi:dipeptidyl aminopeptidase/acylaminoacyl peptidase
VKFSRLALQLVFSITALAASDSPDTREITDPKSVASTPAMGANPIPVDDLFYTRSVAGGAWSPDGKLVVFCTNLTGRNNLWKVSAAGGWPIQLSQSDDRQSGAAWSPDGKWIVFQSDQGGGDLQDEIYGVKFLEATAYVDPKKIGITAGSYGGNMTLLAIGKAPDVWAAAVEEYGIINWLTMLQHEDPFLQQYEKSLLGDPEKDRAVYDADSPLTYIKNAKAPLLVLQGDNDIRVPKEEAEQVVKTLQDSGKTVDAHYYANEGQGFAKRENQIDAIRRTIDWFDRYLKGAK